MEREPGDEVAFCEANGVTLSDLALFELGERFTRRFLRAVTEHWLDRIPRMIAEIEKMACATHGDEKARWQETFLRIVAPDLLTADPFRAWRTPLAPKKAVQRPK